MTLSIAHWLCPLGGSVAPFTFHPPTHGAHPILHVTAFHSTTQPFTFARAALGAPWVRTS